MICRVALPAASGSVAEVASLTDKAPSEDERPDENKEEAEVEGGGGGVEGGGKAVVRDAEDIEDEEEGADAVDDCLLVGLLLLLVLLPLTALTMGGLRDRMSSVSASRPSSCGPAAGFMSGLLNMLSCSWSLCLATSFSRCCLYCVAALEVYLAWWLSVPSSVQPLLLK